MLLATTYAIISPLLQLPLVTQGSLSADKRGLSLSYVRPVPRDTLLASRILRLEMRMHVGNRACPQDASTLALDVAITRRYPQDHNHARSIERRRSREAAPAGECADRGGPDLLQTDSQCQLLRAQQDGVIPMAIGVGVCSAVVSD